MKTFIMAVFFMVTLTGQAFASDGEAEKCIKGAEKKGNAFIIKIPLGKTDILFIEEVRTVLEKNYPGCKITYPFSDFTQDGFYTIKYRVKCPSAKG